MSTLLADTPLSHRIDLVSAVNGRAYRLRVAEPLTPPPAGGWPVLLVLDGDAYFGLMTDAMRNRGCLGHEIDPPLVVAIGYPDDDPQAWHVRRQLDYTPEDPPAGTLAPGPFGGLDGFLDTIETHILPLLAQRFVIDRDAVALFGHSLGGLAVLYGLCTRPRLARSWLAVSPALWCAPAALASAERMLPSRLGAARPRVHIAVGGLEEEPPRWRPPGSVLTLDAAARQVAFARIRGRAQAFAHALRRHASLTVRYDDLPGETHVSVPYAALRMAFDLAFPWPGEREALDV